MWVISATAAQQWYVVLDDGVLTKDYFRIILKYNYFNVNYNYNLGISNVGDDYNWR